MIPLMGLLLCVYLVFKGFELFQIAWCAPQPPAAGIVIGIAAVAVSIVVAALFGYMFITSSLAVPSIPSLP